jgi:hypothetical protein
MFELTTGTLATSEPDCRIEVVQCAPPGEQPFVEFRFQRFCPQLGWLTHRRMAMAPGEVGALRQALNLLDRDAQAPAAAAGTVVPFPGTTRIAG